MKLTSKQKELLGSKTYREIMQLSGIGQSTIKRLRKDIVDMKLGTLEKVLDKVWNMSVKDFFNL